MKRHRVKTGCMVCRKPVWVPKTELGGDILCGECGKLFVECMTVMTDQAEDSKPETATK